MADTVTTELRINSDADLIDASYKVASDAVNDGRLTALEKMRALNMSGQISARVASQRVREVQLGARLGIKSEDALKRLGYDAEK